MVKKALHSKIHLKDLPDYMTSFGSSECNRISKNNLNLSLSKALILHLDSYLIHKVEFVFFLSFND